MHHIISQFSIRESFFTDRRQSDRRISREEYYDKMEKLEAATVHMDLMPF